MWTTSAETIKAGHLLPEADVTYDLGSSSLKWRDLYLSGSTITLGSATISADGSKISSGGGFSGNADTASTLETGRTITLAGDVTATGVSFDGSANITLTTAMAANSVDPGTPQLVTMLLQQVVEQVLQHPVSVKGAGITILQIPIKGRCLANWS